MNKINITKILEKHKMFPKWKAKINIPLCTMILMSVIQLALKIDVLKMEQAFRFRYQEGNKVFYVSPLN
jgi:hypothetical protein